MMIIYVISSTKIFYSKIIIEKKIILINLNMNNICLVVLDIKN